MNLTIWACAVDDITCTFSDVQSCAKTSKGIISPPNSNSTTTSGWLFGPGLVAWAADGGGAIVPPTFLSPFSTTTGELLFAIRMVREWWPFVGLRFSDARWVVVFVLQLPSPAVGFEFGRRLGDAESKNLFPETHEQQRCYTRGEACVYRSNYILLHINFVYLSFAFIFLPLQVDSTAAYVG